MSKYFSSSDNYFNINRTYDHASDRKITQIIECKVDDAAFLPCRAHPSDAGADLKSTETCEILPGEQKLIDTGVAVKIPEGYGGFIFNRSSQGKKGITIPHSVGVIDSDYRGNLKVLLKNISGERCTIGAGDRIAQLVIMPVLLCGFVDAWNDTNRGTGGFGSTGK
jgi:dUTP pyrophosphatase